MARFEKLSTRNENGEGCVVFVVRGTGVEAESVGFNVDVGDEQLSVDVDVPPSIASVEVCVDHHRSGDQLVRVEDPVSGKWIQGTFDLDMPECAAECESGVLAGRVDQVVRDSLVVLASQPGHGKAAELLHAALTRLIDELTEIGLEAGFLSEAPGGAFDEENRHVRTREIGSLVAEIARTVSFVANGRRLSSEELMGAVIGEVQKRMHGDGKSAGLRFAWKGIGGWYP